MCDVLAMTVTYTFNTFLFTFYLLFFRASGSVTLASGALQIGLLLLLLLYIASKQTYLLNELCLQ